MPAIAKWKFAQLEFEQLELFFSHNWNFSTLTVRIWRTSLKEAGEQLVPKIRTVQNSHKRAPTKKITPNTHFFRTFVFVPLIC